MVLSVLDLGSNSFHMAVYRVGNQGRIEKLQRSKEMCRLGAGTLWSGSIDDAAWRRGMTALDRLHRRALGHDPDQVLAVATSAIRDASNGADFCRAAHRRIGLEIEVLSGEEEARLIYWGARSAMPRQAGRIAVIDVGGGSAEIAVGDRRGCAFSACLPLGVLRLRELAAERVAAHVRATAREAMAEVRALRPERVVITSGTARRLASLALTLGLRRPDQRELSRAALRAIDRALPQLRPSDLAALGVEPGRWDTIHHGALIFDALLDMAGAPAARVSSRGLREGVALRELGRTSREARRSASTPARRSWRLGG
jgi:exopolyphosphatase/guanosine-5'-triphosphate,3'-diphosphate pyrophosphatase